LQQQDFLCASPVSIHLESQNDPDVVRSMKSSPSPVGKPLRFINLSMTKSTVDSPAEEVVGDSKKHFCPFKLTKRICKKRTDKKKTLRLLKAKN
jgi:hypothetical protein